MVEMFVQALDSQHRTIKTYRKVQIQNGWLYKNKMSQKVRQEWSRCQCHVCNFTSKVRCQGYSGTQ